MLISAISVGPEEAARKRVPVFMFNRILTDRYGLTPDMIEAYPLTALSLLPQTCALDVAEFGGATFNEMVDLLGVCHQRITQLVCGAYEQLAENPETGPLLRELLEQANEVDARQHDPEPAQRLGVMRAPPGDQTVVVHFQKPMPGSWAWRKRGAA